MSLPLADVDDILAELGDALSFDFGMVWESSG